MRRLARFLDLLLGPRCPYGCGQRLYPKDRLPHFDFDHAGDPPRVEYVRATFAPERRRWRLR